jgi:hypothetical protein
MGGRSGIGEDQIDDELRKIVDALTVGTADGAADYLLARGGVEFQTL